MLKVLLEFRKGILFVRLYGELDKTTIIVFQTEVREVILKTGILYVVLNIRGLRKISKEGILEIKKLKELLSKADGELFLHGGEIRQLKSLIKLESELNVFERIVI